MGRVLLDGLDGNDSKMFGSLVGVWIGNAVACPLSLREFSVSGRRSG